MMKTACEWICGLGLVALILLAAYLPCEGQEAVADKTTGQATDSRCVDNIDGKMVIDAELHSDFFDTTTKQYPWYIVVHADGHLEDTTDGKIDAEDRVQIEHTANCVSTHQGEHKMKFCDARLDGEGKLELHISGGLPAYASLLDIKVDAERSVRCSFSAVYPGPTGRLFWRIKKKELRFSSADISTGSRLHGWISVEFEEYEIDDGEEKVTGTYKIEGFIKPVVESVDGSGH